MSLPPIDQSLLPADMRNAGTERKQSYQAALGFERQLVLQLAKTLSETAKPADDASSVATQTYRYMLPDTVADAITGAGGLGLATSLDAAMNGGAK